RAGVVTASAVVASARGEQRGGSRAGEERSTRDGWAGDHDGEPNLSAVTVHFTLDGREVTVADDRVTLLDALRDHLGARSVKDGCSPQGQCGCCTVLVDGQPRVSCVTPVRRVAGRDITTVDGLDERTRHTWADAFLTAGASQCGFCTP